MSEDSKFHHGGGKAANPIIEMAGIEKHFGNVIALAGCQL